MHIIYETVMPQSSTFTHNVYNMSGQVESCENISAKNMCQYIGTAYYVSINSVDTQLSVYRHYRYNVMCDDDGAIHVRNIDVDTIYDTIDSQKALNTASLALGYGATHCDKLAQYLVDGTDMGTYIYNTTGNYMADIYNANVTYMLEKYRELLNVNTTYACAPEQHSAYEHNSAHAVYVNIVHNCDQLCVHDTIDSKALVSHERVKHDGVACALALVNSAHNITTALHTTQEPLTRVTGLNITLVPHMTNVNVSTDAINATRLSSENSAPNSVLAGIAIIPVAIVGLLVAYARCSNSRIALRMRNDAANLRNCLSRGRQRTFDNNRHSAPIYRAGLSGFMRAHQIPQRHSAYVAITATELI